MSMKESCKGWGVVIIIAAFMVQVITFGISNSIGVYNIHLLQHFNNNAVGVSVISSLNLGLFLGTGPLASYLMTKFEHRTISMCGAVLSSLGLVVIAFWQELIVMCIFYGVIAGFGYCLAYIPSHVLSGLYFDKHRSLATGVVTSGSGLGGAIFPIIIDALITAYGWKASLLLVAGLNMHLLPIAALLRPLPKDKKLPASCSEAECPGPSTSTVRLTQENAAAPNTNAPGLSVPNGLVCENVNVPNAKTHLLSTALDSEVNVNGSFESKMTENHVKETDLTAAVECNTSKKVVHRKTGLNKGEVKQVGNALITYNSGSVGMLDALDVEINASLLALASRGASPDKIQVDNDLGPIIHSWRVFKDFGFNVYFLNNIMWNLGFGVYVTFAPAHYTQQGMSEQDAALMLMLVGLGDFVGGIIGGAMGNLPCCNRIAVFTVANIAMGAAMLMVPLVTSYWGQVVLNICLGLAFGVILGLLVILCVDILGPQNLGTALGYLLLSNGVGIFIGPPLAGALYDSTGTYISAFFMAGVLIIIGGLVMVLIPLQAHNCPQLSLASRQLKRSSAV